MKQWHNFTITPDSTPDLDGWGWDTYWKIEDWVEWHRQMKKKYGVDTANKNFMEWWNKQTTGANPIDARSFNTSFRDYARKNGFFDALYGGMSLLKPIGAVTDAVSNVSDAASNLSEGVKDTTKGVSDVIKVLIPVAIIAVVVVGGYLVYQSVHKKLA